ncbi:MAG: uridine kinase [Candidatus Eiseniibacteriota bacterium]
MSKRILIGIAGGTGSGKTLVARNLVQSLGSSRVGIVDQDSYYRDLDDIPMADRDLRNFDHPDAFDNELLRKHIADLLAGRTIGQPIYDYTRHARLKETNPIGDHAVIILEGILIFVDEELRSMMDIKVFVDTDPDIRLIRRIERDITERGRSIESILRQYQATVRPMHLQFVEPSKRYADIILPEGGYNRVAIDLLRVKVQDLLRERGEA